MSAPGKSNPKQVFSKLAEEVDSLEKRIEKYAQMEDDLLKLPLPRDDFAQRLAAWVDHEADRFPPQLAGAVSHLVDQPYFNPEEIDIHLIDVPGETPAARMQTMLAFLFREQLKDAVQQAVGAMPWPKRVGPPRERRDQMIANLRTKLDNLRNRESELLSAADGLLRTLESDHSPREKIDEMRERRLEVCASSPMIAEVVAPANNGLSLSEDELSLLESLQGDNVIGLPKRKTGTG